MLSVARVILSYKDYQKGECWLDITCFWSLTIVQEHSYLRTLLQFLLEGPKPKISGCQMWRLLHTSLTKHIE